MFLEYTIRLRVQRTDTIQKLVPLGVYKIGSIRVVFVWQLVCNLINNEREMRV